MINQPTLLAALVLVLGFSAPAWGDEFYKWVDDEGVTHYSSEKPKGEEATSVEAENPPSSSQEQALKRLREQREQREKERQAEREKAKEEQNGEDSKAISQERCEKHRQNLQTLKSRTKVQRENPDTGEVETLTEKQQQAMIEKTKKALERCNQNQQE